MVLLLEEAASLSALCLLCLSRVDGCLSRAGSVPDQEQYAVAGARTKPWPPSLLGVVLYGPLADSTA